MTTFSLARTLPLAFVGALAVLPALAQTPAPAAPAPAPAAITTPAPAPSAHAARHNAYVERRIAVLRSRLKITPAQTQAFEQFAQVMRDNASHMDALMAERQQKVSTMSAVDALKSYQAVAQQHLDDMQTLVPAFQTLYDALSPEQKTLADRDFQQFSSRPAGHKRS